MFLLAVVLGCAILLAYDSGRQAAAGADRGTATVDAQLSAPLHTLPADEVEEVVAQLAAKTSERHWRLADAVEEAAAGPPPRVGTAGRWSCATAREVVVCWRGRS
jgi:hypothetical protein